MIVPLLALAALHVRPDHHSASRSERREVLNWSALAECESGGNWHINSSNGYYGGLQMGVAFWRNYGGLSFAPRPDLATEQQQIVVAERGLAVQGPGAWPVCSAYLKAAA